MLQRLIGNEPLMTYLSGVVAAGTALIAAFGGLTAEQVTAICGFAAAVLATGGLVIRRVVTPTAEHKASHR